MPLTATRSQVLRHRFAAQQLDAAPDSRTDVASLAILDIGAQDTGPDGASWALALRGLDLADRPDELALAWSVRGAPHAYRRTELLDVGRAVVPYSEDDAAKRIYDAARPLRAAGIAIGEALGAVALAMRAIVTEPMAKGEVSTRLTAAMPEPYLRYCRVCRATHLYEMPFRLAALHAGLELEPGTSPPVLVPVSSVPVSPVPVSPVGSWPADHTRDLAASVATPPAERAVPEHLDLVRAYLRLLGPARAADVAAYLDAPVRDVRGRLADLASSGEVVEVLVEGEPRWLPAADVEDLATAGRRPPTDRPDGVVRLLGPFDLFLQARDRGLLVPDRGRHAALWPVLGRPGAVVSDGEVVGTWRPRASGARLKVAVEPWTPWDPALDAAVDEQIERLAAFRGLNPAGRA